MSFSNFPGWRSLALSAAAAVLVAPLLAPVAIAAPDEDANTPSLPATVPGVTPIPAGQLKAFDAKERGSGAPVDPKAASNKQVLARGGQGGFRCYRIPALATNNDGEIVAQWDGRPNNCGDSPEPNSIVQKISADNGVTFGEQTVAAAGQPRAPKHGYSDPSLIVDRRNGHMYSFFVKSYDQGIWGSQLGTDPANRNVLHAVYIKSVDGGLTWQDPVFVTPQITEGHETEWKGRFATSGNGIQLLHGPHAGRLLQPYSVWNKNGQKHAVTLYSDDQGATWKRGEPLGENFDENKLVELSDGSVMINSRQTTRHGDRYVAISRDGGHTWGEYYRDPQLVDPGNNASIIRAYPNAEPTDPKAKVLLFSNSANASGRTNGTIKMSCDDGETWTTAKQFKDGAMSYSVMSVLGDGNIGILYEAENNDITFARFNMDWLGGTCAKATTAAEAITVHRGETVQVPVTITNPGPTAVTSGVVTITGPGGWTFGTVNIANLAVGESTNVNVPATPYRFANAGAVTAQLQFTVEGSTATKPVNFNVVLREGEFPVQPVGPGTARIVSSSTAQNAANGADKAIDGRPDTTWHTKWSAPVPPMPHQITIDFGEVREAAHLSVLPRQDDSANGQIKDYEVWAGETQDGMTKVEEGTWDTSKGARIVPLNGANVRFVKIVSKQSYGDQANKWTSIAEVSLYTPSDTPVAHLSVVDNGLHSVVKAANDDQNTFSVGDKLRWSFTVTNTSGRAVTAFPRSGNFANFAPPTAPNCRYAGLAANGSFTCSTTAANMPFHTLTEEDMLRGYFESATSWDATAEREGTTVLSTTVPTGKRVLLRPFNATLDTTKFAPKTSYTVGEEVVVPIRVKGQELRANRYNIQAVNGGGLTTFTGTYAAGSGTDRCGWNNVHGEDGYTCYPKYTVTAEDLAAGFVTFDTQWKVRRTGQAGINAEFTVPVRIELPGAPAPTPTPTVTAPAPTPTPTVTAPAEPVVVTPQAPVFSDPDGTGTGDSITIPTVTGVVYKIDGAPVTGVITNVKRGSATVVTAEAAAGYKFAEGATASWSHTFAALPSDGDTPTVNRIFGADRVKTSVQVLAEGDFGSVAVLASGKGYADALAAGALASAVDGPVVLTMGGSLEPEVLNGLTAAQIRKVYIAGGTSSVSREIERDLQKAGFEVERLGGANRFETALFLSQEAGEHAELSRVFVVDGLNFPDGLAAGSVARYAEAGIVLSNGSSLEASTKVFLDRSGLKVVAVGHNAAAAVRKAGVSTSADFEFVAGEDRYATAASLAARYAAQADYVVLVSGAGYADALPGAALAANGAGVLLLTAPGSLPAAAAQFLTTAKPSAVTILGGTGVVGGGVEAEVKRLLG
ncbi:MAG: cell wall-binding repeat-containing protein [Buchananella hordeovulneris]|nr:cell wall-binding repeat-containing protein [Buchananella hordeovulneris]